MGQVGGVAKTPRVYSDPGGTAEGAHIEVYGELVHLCDYCPWVCSPKFQGGPGVAVIQLEQQLGQISEYRALKKKVEIGKHSSKVIQIAFNIIQHVILILTHWPHWSLERKEVGRLMRREKQEKQTSWFHSRQSH